MSEAVNRLKETVEKAATGDVAAFGWLINGYQDAVYGVGVAILANFHDAQDVAQEVFIQAWQELKSLRDPEKFPGWICRITHNRCLNLLRKRPEKTLADDEARPAASSSSDPRPLLEASERRDTVLRAIGRLSEPLRVPTTLFYINGYSERDVSRMMERPLGTVKRRLHDARQQLRKELMNMVETELKDSRPGPELADHVLQRIRQVRVRLTRGYSQVLMLTDSRKRSFPIMIGLSEAKAIQPWLKAAGSADATDPHTACVRALSKFGCRVEKVTVSELKANTFYGVLKLKWPGGTADVDCRPSDGLNFAVRAKAPIFADNAIVERSMSKDKDGKPMSPEAAWHHVPIGPRQVFRNLQEILQSLEKNPENLEARKALTGWERVPEPKATQSRERARAMLRPGTKIVEARWVGKGDPRYMRQLEEWPGKCEGTKLEGLAAGLIGAVHLWPPGQNPERAIPLLEKARKLQPEDQRIAFDLATAYALSKRTENALSVLPKEKYETARACGNFQALWHDARFRSTVGKPDESHRNTFVSDQLCNRILTHEPGKPDKKKAKWDAEIAPQAHVRKLKRISLAHRRDAEKLVGGGPLLRVLLVAGRYREDAGGQRFVLGTEQDHAAVLELSAMDFGNIDRPLSGFTTPRPLTNETFCNLLRAASIQIESVVLTQPHRSRFKVVLIAGRDGQREVIVLDGPAALSIAFTAKCPVLIAERLAERLYLRDRSGEPLSTKAVIGRVCGQ